jgi:glycolate oxidase FAD binding subunit
MVLSTEELLQSPFLAGAIARSGKDADRIDGIRPRLVVEPRTPEEVGAILAAASRKGLTVVFRGGGTKLGWGRVPADVDLLISMRGLARVIAHHDADLTATVEAGATLEEVNAVLGRHRQWLPIDAAGDGSTIGGAIATNDSGPLRHRFGTPRDLLIGIRLATTDGLLVKAGGNVVKNVAGYDLGKLMTGSFGTLAGIVSATFKLLPIPSASHTVSAALPDRDAAAAAVIALTDSQLEPLALELQAQLGGGPDKVRPTSRPPYRLLARFATSPAASAAQAAQALTLIGTGEIITRDEEAAIWRRYQGRASASAGTVIRMNWLPASLPQVLVLFEELGHPNGSVELVARAGLGAGLIRVDGSVDWQASVIHRLRASADVVRHVTIIDAPPGVKQQVDVWGPLGAGGIISAAVKRALDPAGILNAGRGPV